MGSFHGLDGALDLRDLRARVADLEAKLTPKQTRLKPVTPLGLGYTPVNRAGDTMTGVLHFDTEGIGVVVDAQGFRRFGFMKYLGYNGTIARVASAPFYLGHTNKATVDDVSSGFRFTPDITIHASPQAGVAGEVQLHGGLVTRFIRTNLSPFVTQITMDDEEIRLSPKGGDPGGEVWIDGEVLITDTNALNGRLRSIYGTNGIQLGWNEGADTLDVFVDGTFRKAL